MFDGNLDLALRIRADLTQARRQLKDMRHAVNRNTEAMGQMRTRADGLVRGITGLASSFATLAAGVRAARDIAGFEATLSRIHGLVGVGRDEVTRMGEALLDLAPKVATAPGELAEALFFVTSAGVQGAQALEVLEVSAKAAAAGLGDTRSVADAVTSAMNVYGAETLDAGRATGVLVAAVREGKADAATIAPVLGRLLPIAQGLGVGFDQVAAAVSFFTRQGLGAAEASTTLRGLLAQLLRPAEQAQKTAAELGVDFDGLRKTLREQGLLAALKELDTAVGDNRERFARLFPDIEGLNGVLSLLGSNSKEATRIFEALGDAGVHTVEDAFGAGAQDTLRRYNEALASLSAQAIRFGADVLPVFAEALGVAARHVDLLVAAISGLVGLRVGTAMVSYTAALYGMAKATGTARVAMLGLNTAIRANPIGLLVAATAALTGYALAADEAARATDAVSLALKGVADTERRTALTRELEIYNEEAARLRTEIGTLEDGVARNVNTANLDPRESRLAVLRQELAEVEEGARALEQALKDLDDRQESQKTVTVTTGEHTPEAGSTVDDDAAAKRIAALERERALYGEISREQATRYEIEHGRYREATEAQQQTLLGLARELDFLDAVAGEQARLREEERQTDEEREQARERHNRAIADIEAAGLTLATPYEQARAAISAWKQATLDALDRTAEGWEDHAARIEAITDEQLERLEQAEEERRKREEDGQRHAGQQLQDYAREAADVATQIEQAMVSGLVSMEDALVNFVRTGKLEFKDLANSIIADIARIAIRQAITGPIAQALGGLFGSPGGGAGGGGVGGYNFGGGISLEHTGGLAGGLGGVRRAAPLALFETAPRYHRGGIAGMLRPNEVPIIAERGEEIVTERDPRHRNNLGLGGITLYQTITIESVDEGGVRQAIADLTPEIVNTSVQRATAVMETSLGRPSRLRAATRR